MTSQNDLSSLADQDRRPDKRLFMNGCPQTLLTPPTPHKAPGRRARASLPTDTTSHCNSHKMMRAELSLQSLDNNRRMYVKQHEITQSKVFRLASSSKMSIISNYAQHMPSHSDDGGIGQGASKSASSMTRQLAPSPNN